MDIKKIAAVLLALAAVITLAACGGGTDDETLPDTILVYEDKPEVFGAPYSISVDAEEFTSVDGETISLADIKVPYINLEGEDAAEVNEDLEALYMRLATSFRAEMNGLRMLWDKCDYTYDIDGDTLTVTVSVTSGVTGGVRDPETVVYRYVFNVKTGRRAAEEETTG